MFGLRVKRHRAFETSRARPILPPDRCRCQRSDLLPFMHKGERAYADAMGCDWMTAQEAREAIPPAYTEFIGRELLAQLRVAA
jgi:DNA (cytosine-5)-methyltransferase 1